MKEGIEVEEIKLITAAEARRLASDKQAELELLRSVQERKVLSRVSKIITEVASLGELSHVFISAQSLSKDMPGTTGLHAMDFEILWTSQTIESVLTKAGYRVTKAAERQVNGLRTYTVAWNQ